MKKRKRISAFWPVLGLLAVVAVAVWIGWPRNGEEADVPRTPGTMPVELPPPAPPIRHPVERIDTGEAPVDPIAVPELGDADEALLALLEALVDVDDATALVNPQYLIQRIVATVDNLPSRRLNAQILPVRRVAGEVMVAEEGGDLVLDARNAERYTPYVEALAAVDTRRAASIYVAFYPRFQAAYRELGYPDGYFNDRLIEVIDHLLQAPEVAPPIALARTERGLAFADPALENLSVGHKALIRVGPEHAATLKNKLRALRAALAGQRLPEVD